MLRKRSQICLYALVTMGLIGTVVGCGAPDLRAMSPTVRKPAAEVLLVDQPAHWYLQDVQTAAAQQDVVVKALAVRASALTPALAKATASRKVGMIVVVQNGPIPASELTFAKQHTSTQFTLFGASPVLSGAQAGNIHEVVPDAASVSYALGTLAGDLATSGQLSTVGWLTGGQPVVTQANVRIALAAANAADPGVTMTSVPVAAVNSGPSTGNASGSVAPGTTNLTGTGQASGTQSGVPPAAGGTVRGGPLPAVLVVTQPLTSAQSTQLKSAGVRVVSLCTQPSGVAVAGVPAVPGITAMNQVLRDYSDRVVPASMLRSLSAPLLAMNRAQVAASEQSAVNTVELSLQDQSISLQTVWHSLPTAAQLAWSAIVSQAGV